MQTFSLAQHFFHQFGLLCFAARTRGGERGVRRRGRLLRKLCRARMRKPSVPLCFLHLCSAPFVHWPYSLPILFSANTAVGTHLALSEDGSYASEWVPISD